MNNKVLKYSFAAAMAVSMAFSGLTALAVDNSGIKNLREQQKQQMETLREQNKQQLEAKKAELKQQMEKQKEERAKNQEAYKQCVAANQKIREDFRQGVKENDQEYFKQLKDVHGVYSTTTPTSRCTADPAATQIAPALSTTTALMAAAGALAPSIASQAPDAARRVM